MCVCECRKLSNKQMAETTKRTIRENVGLAAQLNKMSEKTVEIIQVEYTEQSSRTARTLHETTATESVAVETESPS